MNIDKDYSILKVRRKFGSVQKAAKHFSVEPATMYLILGGKRGQKTKSQRILDQLIEDDLIVLDDTSASN